MHPHPPTCTHTHALTHTHVHARARTHKYIILIAFPQQQWLANTPQCYVIRTLPVLFCRSWSGDWEQGAFQRMASGAAGVLTALSGGYHWICVPSWVSKISVGSRKGSRGYDGLPGNCLHPLFNAWNNFSQQTSLCTCCSPLHLFTHSCIPSLTVLPTTRSLHKSRNSTLCSTIICSHSWSVKAYASSWARKIAICNHMQISAGNSVSSFV